MKWKFKKEFSFEKRRDEAERMIKRYPNRIPIIVERWHSFFRDLLSDPIELDHKKYLVPYDITIGMLYYIIRKRIRLRAEDALFILVNGNLPLSSSTVGEIYQRYADEDKFLYIAYSEEAKFG